MVSTEYVDRRPNRSVRSVSESGRFGDSSPKEERAGLVGVPRAEDRDEGCEAGLASSCQAAGAHALGRAGGAQGCTFKEGVGGGWRNASAVVLYNEERHGNLTTAHVPRVSRRRAGTGGARGGRAPGSRPARVLCRDPRGRR